MAVKSEKERERERERESERARERERERVKESEKKGGRSGKEKGKQNQRKKTKTTIDETSPVIYVDDKTKPVTAREKLCSILLTVKKLHEVTKP